MDYYELKAKQRKNFIAFCTLGLSVTPLAKLWQGRNVSKGFSWEKNEGMSFVINGLILALSILVCMGLLWLVSIVRLIYYSIQLHKLKKQGL